MINKALESLLQMKSFIDDGHTFASRENVDNFLLSYISFQSDSRFPALEIGVYEGASAGYLCEALKMQERRASLIDNLHFLKSEEEQKTFVKDVIKANLLKKEITENSYEMIVDSSLTHNWGDQKFSYFHIDAHNPSHDLKTALKLSSADSIIAIDDFLVVPYHLEVVIKAIINQEIFPFVMGTKKIWCTNNKALADKIMLDDAFWNPLKEILRIENFDFFGNKIFKVYASNKYHHKMYNYYKTKT